MRDGLLAMLASFVAGDGVLRRHQLAAFVPRLYRRRSLLETVNSVLKGTMSSATLARRERTLELDALRAIAHNERRAAERVGS